jgi:hypothetical protein
MSYRRKVGIALLIVIVAIAAAWGASRLVREPVARVTAKWSASPHADRGAEAFTHWNEDDPAAIPANCARCHSLNGYLDYLGEDGSAAGTVDAEAPVGSVLYCNTCHSESAHALTQVTFPSQATVTGLGLEANCMTCHQGTAAGSRVAGATADLPDDEVSPDLGFVNVHYAVAAGTQMGTESGIAYEYPGRTYAGRYTHFAGLETCIQCHDPHSLEIDPQTCSPCHLSVTDEEDLADIRSGAPDYDGDGDTRESVAAEIAALHERLYAAIQIYAAAQATPIVYAPGSYPYFMNDTDGDGQADADEVNGGNAYASWTPRLLRAAYNYHYIQEDGGAYAHNAQYAAQVLYDSIADLAAVADVDTAGLARP